MKKLFAAFLIPPIGIAVVAVQVGCQTSSVITNNPDGTSVTNLVQTVNKPLVEKVTKLVAFASSKIAIRASKRPELAADFQLAAQGIDLLLLAGNYDPQALRETLAQINVSPDDELWEIGELVLQSYELLASDLVSRGVDKVEWLRPVLVGIRDGLRFAPVRAVLEKAYLPMPGHSPAILPNFETTEVKQWQADLMRKNPNLFFMEAQ